MNGPLEMEKKKFLSFRKIMTNLEAWQEKFEQPKPPFKHPQQLFLLIWTISYPKQDEEYFIRTKNIF